MVVRADAEFVQYQSRVDRLILYNKLGEKPYQAPAHAYIYEWDEAK